MKSSIKVNAAFFDQKCWLRFLSRQQGGKWYQLQPKPKKKTDKDFS